MIRKGLKDYMKQYNDIQLCTIGEIEQKVLANKDLVDKTKEYLGGKK